MPLRFAPEPHNGSALVQASIGRLMNRPQGAPAALHSQTLAVLKPKAPHPVYDLRAEDIAEGRGLDAARLTGHRYLIGGAAGALAAAEVQSDASQAATLVTNVNFGPFVDATERALAKVATLPQVGGGSYEVRLLRCAALQTVALWLKPDAGGADILYPLAPAPSALKAETPYAAPDLFAALVPLAKKRVANTDASVP